MLARALVAFALLAPPSFAADTLPPNYRQNILDERKQESAQIASPDGWLSMVALERLDGRTNSDITVGSAPGSTVHLAHGAPHAFTLHTTGHTVTIVAADPSVTLDGKPIHPGQPLPPSEGNTDKLTWAGQHGYIIERGDGRQARLYLRISDPNAASLRSFHGLNFYPIAPTWRIHARWVPYTTPHIIRYGTEIGTTIDEPAAGYAQFTRNGQTIRIQGFQSGSNNVQINFRDGTAATTTYGAGRTLVADTPSNGLKSPGEIILDFNEAANWPCAYTPYGTCPLPPKENRFALPIPAGEKRYHD